MKLAWLAVWASTALAACAAPVPVPSAPTPREPDVTAWRAAVRLREPPPIERDAVVPQPSPPEEIVNIVPAPIDPHLYAPVLTDLPDHLVLSAEMSSDLPHTAPELARPSLKTVLTRASVKPADLPQELASWVDAKVQLMGPAGVLCETKARAIELVARFSPSGYTLDVWLGRVAVPDMKRPTLPQIAQMAFAERGANILVTVKVDTRPECRGALWGRLATSSPPLPSAGRVPARSDEASFDYGAAFRTLPSFLQAQQQYQTALADAGEQTTGYWSDDRGLQVMAFERKGAHRVVYLTARSTDDRYPDHLTSLFEETASGLQPLAEGGPLPPITSMVDVDGDGSIEFVGPEVMVRLHQHGELVDAVPPPTLESESGC